MESFLVFDSHNDLIIAKVNRTFLDHLEKVTKCHILCACLEDVHEINCDLVNLINLLFVPYVAAKRCFQGESQETEIQFDCVQDVDAVFIEKQACSFLYVYSKEERKKHKMMMKKVVVFSEICRLLFGCAIREMKSNPSMVKLVFNMMNLWEYSLKNDITFMVEACERLLVGPTILRSCNQVNQYALTKIRSTLKTCSDEIPRHCYLLFGSKLISSCSSHNTPSLLHSDILLFILLSQTLNRVKSFNPFSSTDPNFRFSSDYQHILIFLHSKNEFDSLVPFLLRRIVIHGDLVLIILSESQTTPIASSISNILQVSNVLVNNPEEKRCSHVVQQLKHAIKRIKIYLNYISKQKKRQCSFDVMKKLEIIEKSHLFEFITDLSVKIMKSQLEAQLNSFCESLLIAYNELILEFHANEWKNNKKYQDSNKIFISDIMDYAQTQLFDYYDYMQVKNKRNMTLLGFNQEMPQLISFIYVERSCNQVIFAPIEDCCLRRIRCRDKDRKGSESSHSDVSSLDTFELSQTSEEETHFFSEATKVEQEEDGMQTVSNMIIKAYNQLSDGKLISFWNDNQLQMSYFMWFENNCGISLIPRMKSISLESFPSILRNNDDFIEQITETCFPHLESKPLCFELFCIHQTITDESAKQQVLLQAKKLASRLWELNFNADI